MRPVLLVLLSAMWMSACGPEPVTGPADVRWDRETCTRCAMSVGDNRFAAQVREDAEPWRAFLFDDIGCAVAWLRQQQESAVSRFEIWVNDHNSSQWIDARSAWYVNGVPSPMGYNLAAGPERVPGSVDFDTAIEHVMEVESTRKPHSGGHADHLKVVE